jgi:hypothetical protein
MAAKKDDPTILGSHHHRIFDIHNSWRHPTKNKGEKMEKFRQDPNFSERVKEKNTISKTPIDRREKLGIEQKS